MCPTPLGQPFCHITTPTPTHPLDWCGWAEREVVGAVGTRDQIWRGIFPPAAPRCPWRKKAGAFPTPFNACLSCGAHNWVNVPTWVVGIETWQEWCHRLCDPRSYDCPGEVMRRWLRRRSRSSGLGAPADWGQGRAGGTQDGCPGAAKADRWLFMRLCEPRMYDPRGSDVALGAALFSLSFLLVLNKIWPGAVVSGLGELTRDLHTKPSLILSPPSAIPPCLSL